MSKKYASKKFAVTGICSRNRLLHLIGVFFLALAVTGCPSNGSGGGGAAAPTAADTASALDAVLSAMGVATAGGGTGLAGVSISGETSPQTITFSNCVDPLTGYTLNGVFTSTFTDVLPFPIALSGSVTLTGAPITTLTFDVALSLDPTAGTMTRSGTVAVDGVSYDFAALDLNAGTGGQILPQPGSIWKSSDPDNTFVLFFLPGNLMLPMEKSDGAYGAGGALAMRYDAGQHRFESHDGSNWWASGGFSADGNMMAVSLGTSGGQVWPVFYGGDPNNWWNDTWDYTMWSSGNGHYSSTEYAITGPDDLADDTDITITYSGILDSDSPTSGTVVTNVLTATKTTGTAAGGKLTIKTDGGGYVADNSTLRYATMGNYLVFGPPAASGEPPVAEVAIFQRQ